VAIIKIKICGLTNVGDAAAAVEMGADVLGFNFFKGSPRYIEPQEAFDIIAKLPTYIDTAAVFVNSSHDEIKQIDDEGFFNWLQLHGDETPEFCDELRFLRSRTIKAVRVRNAEDIEFARQFSTDAVLLDAFDETQYGGTGKTFDWNLLGSLHKRIFLAGGIGPSNAVKAIEKGVYGIDVCSSIESSPGIKDHKKMAELFERVRNVRD
jgi:phosphoribosylanthranilate isomerase